jgi:hypothetical protein
MKRLHVFISMLALLGCDGRASDVLPTPPQPGIYGITTGTWYLLSMLSPPNGMPLPDADRTFIDLAIDSETAAATMVILGADKQTANYVFTNGVITNNQIQFHSDYPPPAMIVLPMVTQIDCTVSNNAGVLWFNGLIKYAYPEGPTDAPAGERFADVAASLMPILIIRAGQNIALSWNSESSKTYQVQYNSDFHSNQWINLGPPLPGNGTTNTVIEPWLPSQTLKCYRLLTLP